ncbi:MAG TPA: hypothetical protein VIN10_09790 [Bacteroidales bacterium]
MRYEIKHNSELNYVEVISFGEFTIDNYRVEIDEAARFGREKNTFRFLANNTNLVNLASVSDIYKIPKFYLTSAPERDLKVAALFSEISSNKESVSFYENICVNHGLNVNTFFNREEALSWLLS